MNAQINRLGFDAWADNEFVNAIENFPSFAEGDVSVENDTVTMRFAFTEKTASCVIRAYTESGWQTYEKQIKR